jgi:hypothetical protein
VCHGAASIGELGSVYRLGHAKFSVAAVSSAKLKGSRSMTPDIMEHGRRVKQFRIKHQSLPLRGQGTPEIQARGMLKQ